jgi:hypothetical protein
VIKATEPEHSDLTVTEEAAAVTTEKATPPELPVTNDQFQQIKVDVAFAAVDIRMKEKMKGKLPVERLQRNWDVERKKKLKKGKQSTYVIPKRNTGTAGPKVGSTPTICLPPKGAPGSTSNCCSSAQGLSF